MKSTLQIFDGLAPATEAALRASIERFGILVPVVKDQHGRIIDGHHRARLAEEMKVDYRVDRVPTMTDKIAERFARDTANHQMTVFRDDGLYRHLRFKAPGTGFYWFDLVTWPGRLAFTGDMDGYVFARLPDMFQFFRNSGHGINPSYWSEKVDGGCDRTKRYSEELLRQLIAETVADNEEEWPGLTAAVQEEILDNDYNVDLTFEEGAREALRDFVWLTSDRKFHFTDTWEWDLRDYHWAFLWACHAIQWGIGQYDAARVTAENHG